MMDYPRRRHSLQELLAPPNLEALLVTKPVNVRYLTGFTGEGLLLLGPEPVLCTDRRYEVDAHEQAVGCRVICTDRSHLSSLVEATAASSYTRLGFEPDALTWTQHEFLTKGLPGAELVSAPQLVEGLRARKDAAEVALIERACGIADRALAHLIAALAPGRTEKELSWEFTAAILAAGAEDVSFPLIIASGPQAALPHATVTGRPLQVGDMVVMDVGVKVEGYCSDITRTVPVGAPTDEFVTRYQAVRAAQQAGIAALAVGCPAAEVDHAARQVLEEAGLGEAFAHSLGHGVGLEIHEGPSVSRLSPARLEPGNVVTIEPGVYFPGWGGIRLEELLVLEKSGPRQLTAAPLWEP
ncbi:MAG TPA: Xaa-Pro peptidase family protein [Armatimonadota bacterium]|jgi:Xaa-Pro aminopeptidase